MILDRLIAMARAVHDEEGARALCRELVRAGFHSPKLEGRQFIQLFGHKTMYGQVEEVTFLGVKFLRVTRDSGTQELYSPSAIYGLTPAPEMEQTKRQMTVTEYIERSAQEPEQPDDDLPETCDRCLHAIDTSGHCDGCCNSCGEPSYNNDFCDVCAELHSDVDFDAGLEESEIPF